MPRRGTEELVAAFKEENEDPGDQFWFEREILVDVTIWRPLLDLLLHADLSLDKVVWVARLVHDVQCHGAEKSRNNVQIQKI